MNIAFTHIEGFGFRSFIFSAFLFLNCNNSVEESIIPYGRYTTLNGNLSLNFKDESHLTMEFPGYNMETSYRLVQKEDTKEIHIAFESGNDTLIAAYAIEADSSIYLMSFKMKKEISHHIDEISRFYLNGKKRTEPVNCSSIILDTIQSGAYFIHFENALSIHSDGCDTLFIMHPGLTRLTADPDLRNLAQINVVSSTGKKIDLCANSAEDSDYCIDILGFNQEPRDNIEKRFNENLDGDVLMFIINRKHVAHHK